MRRSSAAALLLFVAGHAAAQSPSLTTARDAFDALRFAEVKTRARDAVNAGGRQPEELASWYFLWGEASAAMDSGAEAEALFGRALEISRLSLLGSDAPPKIARRFQRAEARLDGKRLTLTVGPAFVQSGVARLRVSVTGDVFGMVQHVRVSPRGAAPQTGLPPLADFTWTCRSSPCAYVMEASDAHGNVIARAGSTETPLLLDVLATPRASVPAPPPRPFFRRPLPYFLGGSVFALLAGGMLLGFFEEDAALKNVTSHQSGHAYSEIQSTNRARLAYRAVAIGSGAVSVGLFTTAAFEW